MSHYPDCGCAQCRVRAVKQPINIPIVPPDASLRPSVPEDAVLPGLADLEDVMRRLENRDYIVKDSGERQKFESGMQRDTQTGKADIARVFDGPMLYRWAEHITKGAVKYPDIKPGVPNWTLAAGEEELTRFKKSAARHFFQWMRGDVDEDHAAGVIFNLNGAEYVKEKLNGSGK